MIVLGTFLEHVRIDGFEVALLVKTLFTVVALIIVSSIASNVLSRSTFAGGAPVWRHTSPNRLAEARGDEDEGLTEYESTLADFDIDRGAQLTYQFPQPLGTDEGSVALSKRMLQRH